MHYDLETWSVKNLLLIPSFAFPESAIIKRRPLALTARRAGWVGCNILLAQIPFEARISVVTGSKAMPENVVREQFNRIKPLGEIKSKERGWTLDVLNAIRTLGKIEFTNEDAYTLVPHLEKLHPGNHHVREKIRQRLQVLRDTGLLNHLERGRWRIP
jgi:type II restriction enzyme